MKRDIVFLCGAFILCSGCGLFESEVSVNRPLNNNKKQKDMSDPLDMSMDMKDMNMVVDMKDMVTIKDIAKDLPVDQPADQPVDLPKDIPPDLPPVEDMPEDIEPDMPVVPPSDPVEQVVNVGCTTTIVKGLSQQLIDEMNCIQPGAMRSIANVPELSFYSAVFPYLQDPASRSLENLVRGQSTLTISSALRTLPQQYLLYRWYQLGRCNISLAARPGRSNHNGGLAVDTPNYNAWKSRFNSNSWSWLGSSDPVHFNFNGGQDIRNLSVLALQRLWNRNNPNDLIDEDGLYGNQTESRMKQSPSMGFAKGPTCRAAGLEDGRASMSLVFEGDPSTLKRVHTIAPSAIQWVEYTWNGQLLASTDREHVNFTLERVPQSSGVLLATGFDEEGRVLARAAAQRLTLDTWGKILIVTDGPGLHRVHMQGLPQHVKDVQLLLGGVVLSNRAEDPEQRVISTRPYTGKQPMVVRFLDGAGRVLGSKQVTLWTE